MTQQFLHRLRDECRGCYGGRGPHLEGLMGSPMIVELDPPSDGPGCMLFRLEPLPVDALLFERPDQSFHHPILLRGVGCDELLLETIAPNKPRVVAAREDEPVVRSQ
jgi:hypothetical protein